MEPFDNSTELSSLRNWGAFNLTIGVLGTIAALIWGAVFLGIMAGVNLGFALCTLIVWATLKGE